jgi:tetratricopeptide (TPR) repeat protein
MERLAGYTRIDPETRNREGTASVDWIFEEIDMSRSRFRPSVLVHVLTLALLLLGNACGSKPGESTEAAKPAAPKEVPITTSSAEARDLYLQGRDRLEKLKLTDANALFRSATDKDPDFALAWLGVANSATTANEFFEGLGKAVGAAGKASEGEQHVIRAVEAGTRSEPAAQLDHLTKLAAAYPEDPRVHQQLGAYHFGNQDYEKAIGHYERAVALDPSFTTPYNQLGYAERFLGRYEAAEKAFRKNIELIPDEANPYDSLAELLMKMGRFDESIAQYEKALAIDPKFASAYIGIAHDQAFQGKTAEALATLEKLEVVARNDGERRQALFWEIAVHLYAGKTKEALATLGEMRAVAEKSGDLAAVSGDHQLEGNVFLETGAPAKAVAPYRRAVEAIERANVPEEVKEATRRNDAYNAARIALAQGDAAAARKKAEEYRAAAAAKGVPFEVRQAHEMAARIALEEGNADRALEELASASQQDPLVLYLTALASRKSGDTARAREMAAKTADFNAENINHAFVRAQAQRMLASL